VRVLCLACGKPGTLEYCYYKICRINHGCGYCYISESEVKPYTGPYYEEKCEDLVEKIREVLNKYRYIQRWLK